MNNNHPLIIFMYLVSVLFDLLIHIRKSSGTVFDKCLELAHSHMHMQTHTFTDVD